MIITAMLYPILDPMFIHWKYSPKVYYVDPTKLWSHFSRGWHFSVTTTSEQASKVGSRKSEVQSHIVSNHIFFHPNDRKIKKGKEVRERKKGINGKRYQIFLKTKIYPRSAKQKQPSEREQLV